AVFPLLPCRKCASCQVGEYAQCSDYDYYGSRRDGAYAEYLAVKEWNLVPFEGISYEEAAMCEPAAVALHAIGLADIKIGDTVAIFGAGPIGAMLGLWAKASGAARVILCDIDPNKVEFASKLGFDAFNSAQVDASDYIHEATGGRGADACIEGAGATQTWESCIKSVKSFGHVVSMGNPFGDMTLTQGTYSQLLRKQLTIRGTWNSSYNDAHNDWRTALDAISKHIVDVRPLISHRFKLEDYKQAFDMILARKEFYSKVMFIP
ncbi:MAG: galactitol-1-phosphate 5-dehydrogenase, partial [Bacteroidales bacterium]|nr:galactitol-1-phosphate 5-dehydrogenase [Bacteroidales bacterium]